MLKSGLNFGARGGGGPQLAELGSTEHALMMLVIVELGALILIRRAFKTAHGG